MKEEGKRFSLRFNGIMLDVEEMAKILVDPDYDDPGINWWLHWLDSTRGYCEITIKSTTVRIGLFADFSGCLPELPEWIENVGQGISSCLTFFEQGVDVKLRFEAGLKGQASKLAVFDQDVLMGKEQIDGEEICEEFGSFFETALNFYEKHGVDCEDGRNWVAKIFQRQ